MMSKARSEVPQYPTGNNSITYLYNEFIAFLVSGDGLKGSRSFIDYKRHEQSAMFSLIVIVKEGAMEVCRSSGQCILLPVLVM